MNPRLKVLLAHLPLQGLHINTYRKVSYNIPLAAGYLKAYAYARGLAEDVSIDLAPRALLDFGGDSALVRWIVERRYDAVGFSLYQWNALRTLQIAREAKRLNPALKIVAGGPEVSSATAYLRKDSLIDFLVEGEGELPFTALLRHLTGQEQPLEEIPGLSWRRGNRWRANKPGGPVTDLGEIPSPYLEGFIDFAFYGSMSLETMRGCPFACRYCGWSRCGRKGVSFFPLHRLRREVLLAREKGVAVLDLMDGNANISREWLRKLCAMISEVNADRAVELHCFLRPELLDAESVEWLHEANLTYAVVGLQTTNPDACAAIGRQVGLGDYLRGTELLRKRGVIVKTSIILGLPGDTPAGFRETLDFLSAHDQLNAICCPLSVSPNSALNFDAESLGLRRQKLPPNLVISTPTMTFGEIREGIDRFRTMFSLRDGMALFEKDARHLSGKSFPRGAWQYRASFPAFTTYARGRYPAAGAPPGPSGSAARVLGAKGLSPITRVLLRPQSRRCTEAEAEKMAKDLSSRISWSTLLWIEGFGGPADMKFLRTFLPRLSEENLCHVWNIVVECAREVPLDRLLSLPRLVRRKTGSLDYESLYEQEHFTREYCSAGPRLYALVPLCDPGFSQEWLERLSREVPLFWSVTLPADLTSIPEGGEGYVIDFAPELTGPDVMTRLGRIKDNSGGKLVFFRNWVLQRVYSQYFVGNVGRWGTEEAIAEMGEKGKMRLTVFDDGMLVRELQEWIACRGALTPYMMQTRQLSQSHEHVLQVPPHIRQLQAPHAHEQKPVQ